VQLTLPKKGVLEAQIRALIEKIKVEKKKFRQQQEELEGFSPMSCR